MTDKGGGGILLPPLSIPIYPSSLYTNISILQQKLQNIAEDLYFPWFIFLVKYCHNYFKKNFLNFLVANPNF